MSAPYRCSRRCPTGELERLVRTSADISFGPGEFAVPEGGERALFAVLSGKIEVVKTFDGVERTLGWRLPGTIFGEVPIAFAHAVSRRLSRRRAVARDAGRAAAVLRHRGVVARGRAQKVGALARERIGGLQGIAPSRPRPQVTVVGHRWDPACGDLRRFLARNQIALDWLTPDAPGAEAAWAGALPAAAECPVLRLADGDAARAAELRELAEQLGLQTRAAAAEYDAVDHRRRTGRPGGGGLRRLRRAAHAGHRARGAGRAGRHLVADRELPRLSERRLGRRAGQPRAAAGAPPRRRDPGDAHRRRLDPATREIFLDGGESRAGASLILATGVSWRRLAIEGFDRLIGKGIFYGASRSEASSTHGLDIFLIGAGNSAGQAALHFANHARRVTLVVRGDSLAKSMSHYLIDQIAGKSNIRSRLAAEVLAAHGEHHLEAIDILDRQTPDRDAGTSAAASSSSSAPTPRPAGCLQSWRATRTATCSPATR